MYFRLKFKLGNWCHKILVPRGPMGPHITLCGPYRDFGAPFELALLPMRKVAIQSCQNLAANHSIERDRTVFLYSRSEVSVCDSLSDGSLLDSLSYYGGVISHSHTKWDADGDPTSTTATGMRRNSRLWTLWRMHILWQWVRTPTTLTTIKVQCEGCSTWFHFISSDADNWKCSACSMHWCHYVTIHCGQHTAHNFYILTVNCH